MKRSITNEALLGVGTGYLATKVMDRVTSAYQKWESKGSRSEPRLTE